jgi:hypothetical protein
MLEKWNISFINHSPRESGSQARNLMELQLFFSVVYSGEGVKRAKAERAREPENPMRCQVYSNLMINGLENEFHLQNFFSPSRRISPRAIDMEM